MPDAPAAPEVPEVPEVPVVDGSDAAAAAEPAEPVEPVKEEVETFAKTVGVIQPPPDIKVVIDRTADFVRRAGKPFEKEILARNSKSKKFHFLKPDNPYHAYYQQRYTHGEDVPEPEEEDASLAAPEKPDLEAEKLVKEEADRKALAEAAKKKKKKKVLTLQEKLDGVIQGIKNTRVTLTEAPAKNKYSITTPPMFHAVDIDILKLTSQFVARNGRSFLSGLTAREQRNPQFEFLKPTHPLFGFFQQLVDAYAQIIVPPKELLDDITEKVNSPKAFLEDCLQRAKYEKIQVEIEHRREEDDDNEKRAMQLIDWHQFVIVEEITFSKADDEFLPKPRDNILDINRMLNSSDIEMPIEGEDMDMEEDMDMDMDEDEDDEAVEEEEEEEKKPEPEPAVVEEPLEEEPEPEIMTKQFEPATEEEAVDKSTTHQICPTSGELIRVEDLREHMRIELLDPKWKEQKQALAENKNASSYAENVSISSNLTTLARRRTDVFMSDSQAAALDAKADAEEANATAIWERQKESMKKDLEAKAAAKARAAARAPPPPAQRPGPRGARPPMGRPPPMGQMGRPPMQRPPMGGARPPMMNQQGGPPQRPAAVSGGGGYRMGGARPPMGGARPPMGGARPPMARPPMMGARPPMARPPIQVGVRPPMTGGARPPMARPPMTSNARPPPTGARPPMARPPATAPPPARPPPKPAATPARPPPAAVRPPMMGMARPPMMGMHPGMQRMGMPGMPGMMGMPGMPGMPGMMGHQAPGMAGQPAAKKQKVVPGMVPADQWVRMNPGSAVVKVQIPSDPSKSDWNFNGQTVDFSFALTDTVASVKARLSSVLNNMPTKKMKINILGGVFLNKDSNTLAEYNIKSGSQFSLGVRERGRKKK